MISNTISRRQFARGAAALSLTSALPRMILSTAASGTQEVVVHLNNEIGMIRPELHGQFGEQVGATVYGGLWVGKDSSIPNVNGYRKQAVDYLRALGVPVVRWPGGCIADDYHWRDGIGPARSRPGRVVLRWGDSVDYNSFGTHEFIGLCRELGAEPYLCGNVGSSTPTEFRDWMEYCNYPSGSTLSDERIANGSPEPFKVRYWGVGNELWGCGGAMTAKEYVGLYRKFATFTQTFGGTKPYLIACGPSKNDTAWSRDFMSGLTPRRFPDGFTLHYYATGTSPADGYSAEAMAEQVATFPLIEQAVIQQRALLDGYDSGNKVALIIDEWGVHDRLVPEEEKQHGRLWQACTMRSALEVALGLNLFNRQADKLYMCNYTMMVNARAGLLQTDGPKCIRTSIYHVFALFKPHRSKTAVRVETQDPTSAAFSVSASRAGRDVILTFINTRDDADMQVHCSLGRERAASATAQILHSNDRNAFNHFDNPDLISPQTQPVRLDGEYIQLDLPRLSVVTVSAQLA